MKFYLAWDRSVSLGQPVLGSKTVSANKGKQCLYINHFSSLGKCFNLSHVSSAYFTSMLQGWCENSSIPSLNSHCCYWMHPFLKVIRLLNIVNISVKKKKTSWIKYSPRLPFDNVWSNESYCYIQAVKLSLASDEENSSCTLELLELFRFFSACKHHCPHGSDKADSVTGLSLHRKDLSSSELLKTFNTWCQVHRSNHFKGSVNPYAAIVEHMYCLMDIHY